MRSTNHIKYYTYLRKSSESEDRQVQSIERQADEVEKLIKEERLAVVGTFQESRSAMTPNNRPEFERMIKGIKAGKANGIICWHINRLARNPLESGIVQQLLEDGKILSLKTKDREYTAQDNAIIFSVESSLATQYSKDLGKMTKSGMEKKVSLGIAPIRAPLGYLNTKMAEHGSNYIIKDPDRFEVVRKIWDMVLSGIYVPREILVTITKETGLKPRLSRKNKSGNINLSCLYGIFKNPFYTGLFKYKGRLYKGTHEAMVSIEEFDKVQEILGRGGRPRKQKHSFAYTGIITCGECGCAITATQKIKYIKSSQKNKTYTYYHCTRRKKNIKCESKNALRVSELENQIVKILEGVTISEVFLNFAQKIIKANTDGLQSQAEAIQKSQLAEVEVINKEIKNLLNLRVSDLITDEEYRQEKIIRENKIAMLHQHIRQSDFSRYAVYRDIENKIQGLVNLKTNFVKSTDEGRKRILFNIGKNHTLNEKKLSINKPLWLQVVEKKKESVVSEISRFELEKYVDMKTFSNYFKDMFPLMCALVEEVRTAIITENYHGLSSENAGQLDMIEK